MLYPVFYFLLFSGLACKEKSRTHSSAEQVILTPDTAMTWQKAETALFESNKICSANVGAGGVTTPEYAAYQWLVINGADSQLVRLTSNSNPYAKTYAYLALCKKRYAGIKEILAKNIKDNSSLFMLNGCKGSACSLNAVWLSKSKDLLHPADYEFLLKQTDFKKGEQIPVCIIPNDL